MAIKKMAQHSKLHENKEVGKILIKFLWENEKSVVEIKQTSLALDYG